MVPLQLFTASRLAIVAGKGGVGKTTVTAAVARAAADQGLRVLVVDVDGRPGLAELLGGQGTLPYGGTVLVDGLGPDGTGRVSGRSIAASRALIEYLDDHGLLRVSKRLVNTGFVEVVSTAAPGIDDLLVLGKIKQIERAGDYDLIVVDGPAAGHAITFLLAASALYDAVRVGPINIQARDVLEMLKDPERCQVILVTIPEETPVNETIETAAALEERVGVRLGPIVVNGTDSDGLAVPEPTGATTSRTRHRAALMEAAAYRRRRATDQAEQVQRLADELDQPQVLLPFVFAAGLHADDIKALAAVVAGS